MTTSRSAGVVSGVAGAPELAASGEHGSGAGTASLRQEHVDTDAWPVRSHLELGALEGAVPSARLHARLVVCEWGLPELAEVVELVVSELVTNAVHASVGLTGSRYNGRWRPGKPPIRLWVRSDRRRILVQVWDGNHQLPVRQQPELDDEHGRGLLIVASMTERFGSYRPEGSSGKIVWATLGDVRPRP